MDFVIGINTNAPEMRMVNISGPSICWLPVRMRKQMATQSRARMTDCVVVNGLLIIFFPLNNGLCNSVAKIRIIL